ncbi:hypothetical protein M408DRAFT_31118 [Serendipita vermifera MAFF 305830]|uniref:Uncharacterized protein n=1 Tax=Serendipita vermifera MAFF 305830 TaxID=933852 RepID=A0A0C3AJQ1_SERVB|nr:hypothetical protein M408DRAFT_31118 [Serendipita vermifera MAFF 305830]
MSHPPHQTSGSRMLYILGRSDLAQPQNAPEFIYPIEPPESYYPFFLLQGRAPATPRDENVLPSNRSFYENDCKGCPDCGKLHDEIIEKFPELAMDECNLPPKPAEPIGMVNTALGAVTQCLRINLAFMVHTDTSPASFDQAVVAATCSPEANTTPVTSGSSTSWRKRYKCAVCNHPYDRDQRARDCANKDLGLTPIKAYSNEVLLHEHLVSREERITQCQKCGRSVLRKNMARHRQQAGH